MSPQRFAALAVLCGILVLSSWVVAGPAVPDPRGIEDGGSRIVLDARRAIAIASIRIDSLQALDAWVSDAVFPGAGEALPPTRIASASTSETAQDNFETSASSVEVARVEIAGAALPEPPMPPPAARTAVLAPDSATDPAQNNVNAAVPPVQPAGTESAGADVPVSGDMPSPATLPVLFASVSGADALEELKPAARPIETPDECLAIEICIDDYLWSLYERTPKVDMNKVVERIRVTVKKRGKLRTVVRSIAKYVLGDFTWKDPMAAQRAAMPVKDYVIGGMDRGFKLKLYGALRAMDDAGLMPGITSAFRDDYRQSIASGKKAASDSSFHGGSRRGGYGHGLAADLVSVKGETRLARVASSIELWKWIDAHEAELGIGRPYLDRDPPHVGPTDGQEYAVKRGGSRVKLTGLATRVGQPSAEQGSADMTRPATKAGSGGIGSN